MKKIVLLMVLFLTVPTMAQASSDVTKTSAWRREILETSKQQVTNSEGMKYYQYTVKLRNEREYTLENNAIIENPGLDDAVKIRNVFDFDNGLVYHRDPVKVSQITVTPFTQMSAERIDYIRTLGCYLAQEQGGANAAMSDDQPNSFYNKYCVAAQ